MSNAFETYYNSFKEENLPKEKKLNFSGDVPFDIGYLIQSDANELFLVTINDKIKLKKKSDCLCLDPINLINRAVIFYRVIKNIVVIPQGYSDSETKQKIIFLEDFGNSELSGAKGIIDFFKTNTIYKKYRVTEIFNASAFNFYSQLRVTFDFPISADKALCLLAIIHKFSFKATAIHLENSEILSFDRGNIKNS